jgi:hypothetical protein
VENISPELLRACPENTALQGAQGAVKQARYQGFNVHHLIEFSSLQAFGSMDVDLRERSALK